MLPFKAFIRNALTFLFISFLYESILAGNCLTRNDTLLISRQSQLDSFAVHYPYCTAVRGTIVVSGASIQNLNGLNTLFHIESLRIVNNPQLISLFGLNNLQTAGSIYISNNSSILSLNGLEELDSVNTSLEVLYNASLMTLNGLNSLKKVKNTLSIYANPSLNSLDGLESVVSVSRLSIYGNASMTNLLGLNSQVKLRIIDIWENESLRCCEVVNILKVNNPTLLTTGIFSNAPGCSSLTEIINSSANQQCCQTEVVVQNLKICTGTYLVIGTHMYNSPGVYIDSFINTLGCDSILITQLSMGHRSYTIIQKTLCNSQSFVLSNGRIIDMPGVYLDTIPYACDSVVEYHVAYTPSTVIEEEIVFCEGQQFVLPNGRVITEAGFYVDTVRNDVVCDVCKFRIN